MEVECETLKELLALAQPTKNSPLPKEGRTRFCFLTLDGAYTAEAQEEELGNGRHPSPPLFYKTPDVLPQARSVDEEIRGRRDSGDQGAERFQALMHFVTNGDAEGTKKVLESGMAPNVADPTGL